MMVGQNFNRPRQAAALGSIARLVGGAFPKKTAGFVSSVEGG
jgi:hypothetical protein